MHSERDIYGNQKYSTMLSENSRLAKAKTDKTVETSVSTQIYINIFSGKSRLSCFENITEEDNSDGNSVTQDVLSKNSITDNNKLFDDFGDIPINLKEKDENAKEAKIRSKFQNSSKELQALN